MTVDEAWERYRSVIGPLLRDSNVDETTWGRIEFSFRQGWMMRGESRVSTEGSKAPQTK